MDAILDGPRRYQLCSEGKYRKLVDEKLAVSARHLLDIARSLPDVVWKDCSWTTGDPAAKDITPASLAQTEVFLARGLKEPSMADWKSLACSSIGQSCGSSKALP